MPDQKISALTEETTAADNDVYPVVENASATTKKVKLSTIATYFASLAQTLTNKTLTSPTITSPTITSPTITSPTINTSITGTAVDTDGTLTANSDTKLASQKATKTYGDRALIPTLNKSPFFAPQGFLINGKFVPSVTSNNLTVALKTLAGTDPSASDPVYCRIGDTVRSVTAALSVTKNAGTNWCNAGSAELATQEIDWFVYLGYNATDGVVLGFSRIPFANKYGDFNTTSTNEKYCAISTITNATANDYYELVGRFAATLGASATYYWSVPTFTATNLIQRPINETRYLTWIPTFTGFTGSVTIVTSSYQIIGKQLKSLIDCSGTSNATTFTATAAISIFGEYSLVAVLDNSVWAYGNAVCGYPSFSFYKSGFGSFTNSGAKGTRLSTITMIS